MEPQTPLLAFDEETCWQAVCERSAQMDGQFVYAVRSTGIFCKPSCASRRAQRANVVFYPSPAAARAAGYRPCKRCRPEQTLPPQVELAEQAAHYLDEHPQATLAELGTALAVSPYHLQRVFKAQTGLSPRQYAAGLRWQALKNRLRQGEAVSEALYQSGYGSHSRVYEAAARQLGMTPAVYRRGGKDMQIHFTIVDCPLGRMLLAGTAKGICFLSFGDQDAALQEALAAEYPAAELLPDTAALQTWLQALQDYLAGQRLALDLPLDVQATAFQLRVWAELRRIPYGEVRTYSQVAEAVGNPAAVRAVASACAANPVSVVTPCHRVLRRDGGLGGYRWGLARKQTLLAVEQNHKP